MLKGLHTRLRLAKSYIVGKVFARRETAEGVKKVGIASSTFIM
jgi:hypothetical protein